MRNYGINDTFSLLNGGLSDVLSTFLNVNKNNHNFFFAIKLNDFSNNSSFPLSLIYYKREDNNEEKTFLHEMFPKGIRLSLYRTFSSNGNSITMQNADGRRLVFNKSGDNYYLDEDSSYIYILNGDYCYVDKENGLTYKYSSSASYPYIVESNDINRFPSLEISVDYNYGVISFIIFSNGYKAAFTYTDSYVDYIVISRRRYDSVGIASYEPVERINFSYSNYNSHINIAYSYYHSSGVEQYYDLDISLLESNYRITFTNSLNESLMYSFLSGTPGACDCFAISRGTYNTDYNKRTRITYSDPYLTSFTDINNNVAKLFFDNSGLPVYLINQNKMVTIYEYDDVTRSLTKSYKTISLETIGRTDENTSLLSNRFFTNSYTGWNVINYSNVYYSSTIFPMRDYYCIPLIEANKVSQTIDYIGLPEEDLTLCAGIRGSSNNVYSFIKITLYDSDNNIILYKKKNTPLFNSSNVFQFIALHVKPHHSFDKIMVEVGSEDSNLIYIGSVQLLRNTPDIEVLTSSDNISVDYCSNKRENINLFDNDGRTLLSASSNGTSIFYDYSSGEHKIQKIKKDFDVVDSYSYFSSNPKYLTNINTQYSNNDASNTSYSYSYDCLSSENTNGNSVSFQYNSKVNVDSITYDNVFSKNYTFLNVNSGPFASITLGDNLLSETTSLSYDSNFVLSSVSTSNATFEYNYSSDYQLDSVTINNTNYVTFTYNSDRIIETKTINNYVYQYNYDSSKRLTSVSHGNISLFSYSYDELSRVSSVNGYQFIYSENNEISKVTYGNFTIEHTANFSCGSLTKYSFNASDNSYIYCTDNRQSLYLSPATIYASLFAKHNISSLLFFDHYNDTIYNNNDVVSLHSNLILKGFETIIPNIEGGYKTYKISTYNSYHCIESYHEINTTSKCLTYTFQGSYEDDGGDYIAGYFLINSVPSSTYGTEVLGYYFLGNSSFYSNVVVKNGKFNYRIGNTLYELEDCNSNSWYYISMSIKFLGNNLNCVAIRINENVYQFNSSNSVLNSNISITSDAFSKFAIFGAPSNTYSDSSLPIYGYARFVFASNNHRYLSFEEDKDLFLTVRRYLLSFESNYIGYTGFSHYQQLDNVISDSHYVDIIPLTNSFTSLRNNRPIESSLSYESNAFNNSSFQVANGNYSYLASGNKLVYYYNGTYDNGSVMLDYEFNTYYSSFTNNKRYFFEIKSSSSQLCFGLYLLDGNVHVSYYNNDKNIGSLSNFYGGVGVSWQKVTLGTRTLFRIKVFGKNGQIGSFFNIGYQSITGFKLSIGRKLEEVVTNFRVDSYPLYGFLTSVIFHDSALDAFPSAFNNAINRLTRIDNKYHKITANTFIGGTFKSEYIIDASKGSGETYNKHLVRYDQLRNINYNTFKNTYSYNSSNLLSSVTSTESNGTGANYNIISSKTINYTYDALFRIKTYNDATNNKTITYNYSSSGNITSVTSNITGPTITTSYSYDSNNRLTMIGSDAISYSSSSLVPLSYKGNTFSYNGNILMSISNNGSAPIPSMSFTYDYQNRRLTKTVNGCRHDYYYDGNLLIYEKIYNTSSSQLVRTLQYFYDENNRLIFFKNNGDKYFYYIDSFGVIRGLYTIDGVMVVKYEYDPWGNILNITDNSSISLSTINPFLYKGYYYDHESNWYYCFNRYYIPSWFRWLTPDDYSYLEVESVEGYNPYTYCGNNPVMMEDKLGNISASTILIGALLGFISGTANSLLSDYKDNGYIDGSIGAKQYVLGIVGSTIGGAVSAIGDGTIYVILSSGFGNVIESLFLGEIDSFQSAFKQFGIGAFLGAIEFGIQSIMHVIANKKIMKIIGSSGVNIKINKRLTKEGYKFLKVGKLGIEGVKDALYKLLHFKLAEDIVTYIADFAYGFIPW